MNMISLPLSAAVLLAALPHSALAQATSLAVPGDAVDVLGTPSTVIGSSSFLADTSQGGFVFDIAASPDFYSYGRIATEPLQVFGDAITNQPFVNSYAAPDGRVLHSNFGELLVDGVSIGKVGGPVIGIPGATWVFLLARGITDIGEELVYGIYDKLDGSRRAGAFVGIDNAPVFSTDMPLGLTNEVGYVISIPSFSPDGQHVMFTADLLSVTGFRDQHVILDGVVYSLGGSPVAEGQPVPISIGGLPGESWRNFSNFDLTNDGRVLMTGDTDGATNTDDFIIRDGVIFLREGDQVDGESLKGSATANQWSLDGRVAWAWSIDTGSGAEDVIGLERRIRLRESDPMDWDADGFADEGFAFTQMGSDVLLTGDSTLVFRATVVDPLGFVFTTVFDMPTGFLIPRSWLVSAGTGGSIDFDLDAGIGSAGQYYALAGSMSGTSPGYNVAGKTVPLTPDSYLWQILHGANTPSFMNTIGILDSSGRASAQIVVPVDPTLIGVRAHHAAIRFDLGPLIVHEVSAPVAVEIVR